MLRLPAMLHLYVTSHRLNNPSSPLAGVENNRECSYNKPFFRGRVSTPPPPPSDDPWARNRARGRVVDGKEKRLRSWESIACDVCRITKEKCSGKTPCEHCFAKRIACSYKK